MLTSKLELRRIGVGVVIVAAHVALIVVLSRGTRRAAEVLEITFFPLPITLDDRPKPAPVSVTPQPEPGLRRDAPIERTPVTPAPEIAAPSEPDEPDEPAPSIDWNAQIQASAAALQKRADTEREQYSFTSPRAPAAMSPKHVKPPCPFEKCEPTWGADFSVFGDQSAKKGRIEKTPDGELIRWTSESCYQILITDNIMHRAMTKCIKPLRKDAARGDLFKHMRDVPPPEEKATDVP